MEKKRYSVGCTAPEDWKYIHQILIQDGTLDDNIPKESIDVGDLKEHSPTRAVYLLTDDEAEMLRMHEKVLYVNLAQEDYSPPADELKATQDFRYTNASKHYRGWSTYNQLTTVGGAATVGETNRSGYQLYRHSQKDDPWLRLGVSGGDSQILNNRILKQGTGIDVDVIVADEGCWIGHVEFQNDTGDGPSDYVGGNLLPGDGTCDVLDLIMDAPYYIDPDFFNANPASRLTTRWDGTVVPVESVARNWWRNSTTTYRSVGFTTFGTALVSTLYSRIRCNGTNNSTATNGSSHGTQCSAATFGRTQGWAYNANKWTLNLYGSYGSGIEAGFDAQKLFHQMKPVNSTYGTKDPTISSNSWGYRTVPGSTGYWYYRGDVTGVSYTNGGSWNPYSVSDTRPGFMRWVGWFGDYSGGPRMKGEMRPNSTTQALDELIDSGVIFVGAAGNSNQKQVSYDHPDFNNFRNSGAGVTVGDNFFSEFGLQIYPYTNRRGFPQHGGYTRSGVGGTVYTYPVINIGALDDNYSSSEGYRERKVTYSDMGNEIDCFAAADGILTAGNVTSGYSRPDNYPASGYSYFYDVRFSGTSAACPVACGLIATKLQYNRDWTWQDVRNWLKGREQPVGVTTVGIQSSINFYRGIDSSAANDSPGIADWADVNSLEGADPVIIWDAATGNEVQESPIINFDNVKVFSGNGLSISGNVTISYQ